MESVLLSSYSNVAKTGQMQTQEAKVVWDEDDTYWGCRMRTANAGRCILATGTVIERNNTTIAPDDIFFLEDPSTKDTKMKSPAKNSPKNFFSLSPPRQRSALSQRRRMIWRLILLISSGILEASPWICLHLIHLYNRNQASSLTL